MLVLATSLGSAGAQILYLLILARILGSASYGFYSISVAIATVAAAITTEWLRLLIARFSTSKHVRFSASLLTAIWRLNFRIGFVGFCIGAGIVTAAVFNLLPISAGTAIAISIASLAMIFGEPLATYLRFKSTNATFSSFAILRACSGIPPSLAFAATTHSADSACVAFYASNLLVTLVYRKLYWHPTDEIRIRNWRTLLKFGGSLSASSITLNGSLAIVRIGLSRALPNSVSGDVLLSLDLANRGLQILGSSLNITGSRTLFRLRGNEGIDAANRWFRELYAPRFVALWGTIALIGCIAAIMVPALVHLGLTWPQHSVLTSLNLAGLYVLYFRLFAFDVIATAQDRPRAVLVSSLTFLLSTTLFSSAGFVGFAAAAQLAMPAGALAAMIAYATAAPQVFGATTNLDRSFIALKALSIPLIGLVLETKSAALVILLVFALIGLDIWWLRLRFRTLIPLPSPTNKIWGVLLGSVPFSRRL